MGVGAAPIFREDDPDVFDFIIIDECHYGGAKDESEWRRPRGYFAPAIQLGLIATPVRKHNAETYAYALRDRIEDRGTRGRISLVSGIL